MIGMRFLPGHTLRQRACNGPGGGWCGFARGTLHALSALRHASWGALAGRGVVLVLLALPLLAHAEPEPGGSKAPLQFKDDTERERFKDLTEGLRCLVCQNQTLADSDASLAQDLRREIHELMQKGKSDQQIVEFLVSRYGDFVLYRPPVKTTTYALWFGPFLLLILGLFVLTYMIRRRTREPEAVLTEDEKKRVQQLLGGANKENPA
jgi:cytochrome c-type biogenesis protein CcmH